MVDTEFKGVLVQYTVKAESGQPRVIQKNDYLEIFELGQELTLFIHPNDLTVLRVRLMEQRNSLSQWILRLIRAGY